VFFVLTPLGSAASKRDPGHLRASAPLPVRALQFAPRRNQPHVLRSGALVVEPSTFEPYCDFALLLCCSVALKAADPETDALEECLLVMKPCDPEDSTNDDECLDEEVLRVSGALHSRAGAGRVPPWRQLYGACVT
jgi:hypothetical protein